MNYPKLMKTAVAATAAVSTLGLYALKGRSDHPGLEALQGWAYAHRGLHRVGIPKTPWPPSGPLWKRATASSWTSI